MEPTPFYLDTAAEELKQLIVESQFNSHWMLIEAYHKAGGIVLALENHPDNNLGKDELVQALAQKIGKSERTLQYAVKFKQTYPELNDLPVGKNITWNKVVTKYLTTPKVKEPCVEHKPLVICIVCRQILPGYDAVQK